jgi:5-methylcytosine-specific restriction endonuclease McrA
VDHIIPIEAGGAKLDPDNLQTVCKRCHTHKTFNEDVELIRRYKEQKRHEHY